MRINVEREKIIKLRKKVYMFVVGAKILFNPQKHNK